MDRWSKHRSTDLYINAKTIKLLEENTSKSSWTWTCQWISLDISPKNNNNNKKQNFIKIKNESIRKYMKLKRKPKNIWLTNLIQVYYPDYKKRFYNSVTSKLLSFKTGKRFGHFPEETIQMASYMKKCSVSLVIRKSKTKSQ